MIVAWLGAGALVAIAVKFVSDCLTESGKRKYTKRLLTVKRQYYKRLEDIETYRKSIARKRIRLEFRRREALRMYLSAESNFLHEWQKILHDAKQDAYDNARQIRNDVLNCCIKHKALFQSHTVQEFRYQINNVHTGIRSLKLVEQMVVEKRRLIKNSLQEIPHESRVLGSKKKIEALLENINSKIVSSYKGKNALESLDFFRYSFPLDSKCKNCGLRLSGNMQYCFSCGSITKSNVQLRFYKKYVSEEICKCSNCNAPLESEFRFCYSCGKEQDHFGFYKLI